MAYRMQILVQETKKINTLNLVTSQHHASMIFQAISPENKLLIKNQ